MMSIMQNIKNSPSYVSALRKYEALPSRDQKALRWLSVFVVIVLLYFVVWAPASQFEKREEAALASSKALLSWVKENEPAARAMGQSAGQGNSKIADSQSLVSTISANARQHKIKLKRFEPSGDRKVRIWLEKVPFKSIVVWLRDLKSKYQIEASQVSIDKDETGGLVNVRLTLKG